MQKLPFMKLNMLTLILGLNKAIKEKPIPKEQLPETNQSSIKASNKPVIPSNKPIIKTQNMPEMPQEMPQEIPGEIHEKCPENVSR